MYCTFVDGPVVVHQTRHRRLAPRRLCHAFGNHGIQVKDAHAHLVKFGHLAVPDIELFKFEHAGETARNRVRERKRNRVRERNRASEREIDNETQGAKQSEREKVREGKRERERDRDRERLR